MRGTLLDDKWSGRVFLDARREKGEDYVGKDRVLD